MSLGWSPFISLFVFPRHFQAILSLLSFSMSTFALLLENIDIFIEVVLYFGLNPGWLDIFRWTMIQQWLIVHLLCVCVFWVQGWTVNKMEQKYCPRGPYILRGEKGNQREDGDKIEMVTGAKEKIKGEMSRWPYGAAHCNFRKSGQRRCQCEGTLEKGLKNWGSKPCGHLERTFLAEGTASPRGRSLSISAGFGEKHQADQTRTNTSRRCSKKMGPQWAGTGSHSQDAGAFEKPNLKGNWESLQLSSICVTEKPCWNQMEQVLDRFGACPEN